MKPFFTILIFLFLISETDCFAQNQSVAVDTNYIQTLVDSCKALYGDLKAENSIITGENAISVIELSLVNADAKTRKKMISQKSALLRTIGNNYKDIMVDFPRALDYYQRSLKSAREVDDKVNSAGALFNTGSIYNELKDYNKALDYLNQSLKVFQSIDHTGGIAIANSSIGAVYNSLNQDSLALKYYQNSLNLYNEIQDTASAATQLNSMAEIFVKQKRYSEAFSNYQTSLKMYEAIGDSFDIAFSLAGIGIIYQDGEKNLKKAEEYFLKALDISRKFNLELQKEALNALKDLYHGQRRYKEAFEMGEQYNLIKDSISSQQNVQEVMRRELVTDFGEKQAKLQAEKEKDAAVAEEKSRRQKVTIWSVVAGLVLVAVFSVFVLNRWRLTQRQNKIIEAQKTEVETQRELADSRRIIAEEQKGVIETQKAEVEKAKHEVEEKNKDITDSINYAQRIQRAVLPHRRDIRAAFPESFVLFRPKDIVSGDFYWAAAGKDFFNIGCCDCTGHGVPGAFMSLLNISFLNQTVKERGITDPDKILNDVRQSIVRALNPDGNDERKDGMDAVLCSIDIKNKVLHAACANNPIWYIQNGELKEIKPDKMPVGSHTNMEVSFTKHSIQLQDGDSIYLFTDGYADQFGGPKNKKFRYKQLEDILLANTLLPMKTQKDILENAFMEWKGKCEQVDDVLVIGIRI